MFTLHCKVLWTQSDLPYRYFTPQHRYSLYQARSACCIVRCDVCRPVVLSGLVVVVMALVGMEVSSLNTRFLLPSHLLADRDVGRIAGSSTSPLPGKTPHRNGESNFSSASSSCPVDERAPLLRPRSVMSIATALTLMLSALRSFTDVMNLARRELTNFFRPRGKWSSESPSAITVAEPDLINYILTN